MYICALFTQHGHNQKRMMFLISPMRRLSALLMPVMMVLLPFTFAAGGAAAQTVHPVLADASRSTPSLHAAPVAAEGTAAPTMFPHPDSTRYFLAGQANIIFQAHGPL